MVASRDLHQNSHPIPPNDIALSKTSTPRRVGGSNQSFLLQPPLADKKFGDLIAKSPQFSLKNLPLMSSCLPSSIIDDGDMVWMEEYLLEAKHALGFPLESSYQCGIEIPAMQFDTMIYLAFQHRQSERFKVPHVGSVHTRLSLLGFHVIQLGFAEYFLQRFPRDLPSVLRERVFRIVGRMNVGRWIKGAGLQNLVLPFGDLTGKEDILRDVFSALFGAVYVCFGMPEVYRVLFEVFGMDQDHVDCQPEQRKQLEDVDFAPAEFDHKKLSWEDLALYKGVVMAEMLLMKHVDAPGAWLTRRHDRLVGKMVGRHLRHKKLHRFIIYSDKSEVIHTRKWRLRYPTTAAVLEAIHGVAYTVYGKPEVRRLLFDVFDVYDTHVDDVYDMFHID